VKRFEELHVEDQNMLLFTLFSVFTAASCKGVDALAEKQGTTSLEVLATDLRGGRIRRVSPLGWVSGAPEGLSASARQYRPMSDRWRAVTDIFAKIARPKPN
jgi:hypothetical protein